MRSTTGYTSPTKRSPPALYVLSGRHTCCAPHGQYIQNVYVPANSETAAFDESPGAAAYATQISLDRASEFGRTVKLTGLHNLLDSTTR